MIEKGFYKHFKGMLYEVVDTAKCSETMDVFVIYRALYGEKELWIRPLTMFQEVVTREGKTFPRFEFLGVDKVKLMAEGYDL